MKELKEEIRKILKGTKDLITIDIEDKKEHNIKVIKVKDLEIKNQELIMYVVSGEVEYIRVDGVWNLKGVNEIIKAVNKKIKKE